MSPKIKLQFFEILNTTQHHKNCHCDTWNVKVINWNQSFVSLLIFSAKMHAFFYFSQKKYRMDKGLIPRVIKSKTDTNSSIGGIKTASLVKTQYVHFRLYVEYFLLLWKICEEISRWSMLFHNKRDYLLSNICT